MAESVYVLTEQKLQTLVTSIMQSVNSRINAYIDQDAISSSSRADKIASPHAVFNALQNVTAVVPIVNTNQLAVGFSLINNPDSKVIYVVLESEDSTDGIPYIFIPDPDDPNEGTFVNLHPASSETSYEHIEFTDAHFF